MKQHIVATIIGSTLLFPAIASESPDDPYWWFGLSLEYYNPDEDRIGAMGDTFGFGEEFGYRFNPSWAGRVELTGLEADVETERLQLGDFIKDSGMRYGADVMYFIDQRDTYVFTGIKRETLGDEPNLFNLGLGRHWHLNRDWNLFSEATWYREFGENNSNFGIRFGVSYKFGRPSEPRPPADSDNDGVINSKDRCPGSETRAVDRYGCAIVLDSDSDGVSNRDDKCPNTERGVVVDSRGCPVIVERPNEIQFTAFFDHDSAKVTREDNEGLRSFAARIRANPDAELVIEGHASRPGTLDYNLDLSMLRAEAIKKLLVDKYGVDEDRIVLIGHGETDPLASGKTVLAEKLNRRIEATLTITEKVKLREN